MIHTNTRTNRTTLFRRISSVLYFCSIAALSSLGAQQPTSRVASDSTVAILGPRLGFSPVVNTTSRTNNVKGTNTPNSPTACLMAAFRAEYRSTRTAAAQRDQAIIHPDTLPLAPQTARIAKACSAKWTVANTPPVQLPSLFRLVLLAGQDDHAVAIGTRWTRVAGPIDTAKGEALLRQLQLIAFARSLTPARQRWMRQLVADIQALGPHAIEEHIDALNTLLQLDDMRGDYTQQIVDAETIRQLIRQIPSAEERDHFATAMLEAGLTAGIDRFYFPFELASPQLHTLVEQGLREAQRDLALVDSHHKKRVIIPTTFKEFMYSPIRIRNDSLLISLHVVPTPTLVAQHWYGRPDTTATYPHHGALTVVLPVQVCSMGSGVLCLRTFAAWRKLYAEFAPRGVDFILLTKTSGSFGLSTLLPVAADVDSLQTYFRNQLQLPGVLAIQETTFRTLSDGRKVAVQGAPQYAGVVTRAGLLWSLSQFYNIGSNQGYEQMATFLRNVLAHPIGAPASGHTPSAPSN